MIGVVGGMGPWATADLLDKIAQETIAEGDQDHLPVVLLSAASRIADRTSFMEDRTLPNPGIEVASQVTRLIDWGATTIGAPCNTLHLPPIFEPIQGAARGASLVSIVDATTADIRRLLQPGARVGLLGTRATMRFELYDDPLRDAGFEPVRPDEATCVRIHEEALYGRDGIKRTPGTVSDTALNIVDDAIARLCERGADCVVLACTELPIVLRYMRPDARKVPLVDPTRALARGLIASYDRTKLRP